MMASCAVLLLTLGWLPRSSIRGEAISISLSLFIPLIFSLFVSTLFHFSFLFLQLPLLSLSLISSSCSQTHSQYLYLSPFHSLLLIIISPPLPPSLSLLLSCFLLSFPCPHINNGYHVQYVLYLSFKAKFIWPAVLLIEGFITYSVYMVHYATALI